MKHICLIFLMLSGISAMAVDGKDVLRKIRSNYENLESFESGMNYTIYRGFKSTKPVEEYTGYFCRKGENSYRKIHESEFFNFADEQIFLQLDHRDNSMYIGNAVAETMFEADLEKSLKMCSNILVKDRDNNMQVSLILSKDCNLPYCRVDLVVTADYWIQGITLFYNTKANFSKVFNQPDMDWVRMEITYSGFNRSWQDNDKKLNAEKYLNRVGEAYMPASLYKDYSIVDLRK